MREYLNIIIYFDWVTLYDLKYNWYELMPESEPSVDLSSWRLQVDNGQDHMMII